jgi:hypothetical protein
MNLAYRDIRHNLGRFLLTCFGLSLLLGVVLSMIGIYRGLVEDALTLVRNTFTVVGLTDDQVSSGGDPVVYITLLDSQELQFELAPPAARRELARGGEPSGTDTINAVIARVSANAVAESVAEAALRWKHLSAMTQAGQEEILTQSVVERARKQIGLFTAILLVVSTVIIALILYTMTMDKLKEIAREQDAAILIVTHDEKVFDRFDRIFHLRDGKLVNEQEGKAEDHQATRGSARDGQLEIDA